MEPNKKKWYAVRVQIEWDDDKKRRADKLGIMVFRVWPSAATYWREEWGSGDPLTGYSTDPARACLELAAASATEARSQLYALGIEDEDIIAGPEYSPGAERDYGPASAALLNAAS